MKIATSILIVFLMGGQFIFSQTIKGKIKTDLGYPIGDITVCAQGTNHSVQSRPDGSFEIEIDSRVDSLVFSQLGYLTLTKKIDGKFMNITMQAKVDVVEIIPDETSITEEVFERQSINEQPIFPGGESELNRFIETHIQYPEEAKKYNISGNAYVRFVITKTGHIGETQIMKSAHPLLDTEAIRIIKSMPLWTPGKKDGIPVNVWYIVPFKFKSPAQ
jgi:protein TonB